MRKRTIKTKRARDPPPPDRNNRCEQVKSDINLINSVAWQDGQRRSTEKAKSRRRYISYVRKDFQFELHSARKL